MILFDIFCAVILILDHNMKGIKWKQGKLDKQLNQWKWPFKNNDRLKIETALFIIKIYTENSKQVLFFTAYKVRIEAREQLQCFLININRLLKMYLRKK